MKTFKEYIAEAKDFSHIKDHPMEKMRDYTDAEFPWEYREYTKYAKPHFPKAFDSADHFKKKYDEAPMRHLSHDELHNLDYSTASSWMHKSDTKKTEAHETFEHHRDLSRIYDQMHHGKMPPPIVLKHSKGLRILGGNTRLSLGLAHDKNIPVKVVDISDRH